MKCKFSYNSLNFSAWYMMTLLPQQRKVKYETSIFPNDLHFKFLILFQHLQSLRPLYRFSECSHTTIPYYVMCHWEFVWKSKNRNHCILLNGSAFLCHVQKGSLFVYTTKTTIQKNFLHNETRECVFIWKRRSIESQVVELNIFFSLLNGQTKRKSVNKL